MNSPGTILLSFIVFFCLAILGPAFALNFSRKSGERIAFFLFGLVGGFITTGFFNYWITGPLWNTWLGWTATVSGTIMVYFGLLAYVNRNEASMAQNIQYALAGISTVVFLACAIWIGCMNYAGVTLETMWDYI